ncbi:IS66 family insertion sequence element accessory protein TnpB [Myxococcota bacterium]
MMRLPTEVYVATEPVNLHFSFDRLAGIVREQLGGDPRSEALFVFHNRRRTHVKILWHDGRGYWLLYKRLDRGTYRIPLTIPPGARSVKVSRRELSHLVRGVDRHLLRRACKNSRHKKYAWR